VQCVWTAHLLASTSTLVHLHSRKPSYTLSGSGEGTRKWYLYHEGGGWCSNLRDCFLRAHGANGSTIYRNQTMGLPEGYFSTDKWVRCSLFFVSSLFLLAFLFFLLPPSFHLFLCFFLFLSSSFTVPLPRPLPFSSSFSSFSSSLLLFLPLHV
jgi:hypothetical protein